MSVSGLPADHEVAVAMMAHERLGAASPLQAQGVHASFDAVLRAVCYAASTCVVRRRKGREVGFLKVGRRIDASAGLFMPLSVVVDNHGDGIYVLDGARPSVKVFEGTSGKMVREFGYGELSGAGGMAMREGGEILVSDSRGIVMYQRGGFLMRRFAFRVPGEDRNVRCSAFAVDVDDNLVLTDFDGHRVLLFDREERLMRVLSSQRLDLHFPHLVAITQEGNILVGHRGEEKLVMLSKYGERLFSLRAEGEQVEAEGIAVDGENTIIVVERKKRRIVFFTSAGVPVGVIGFERFAQLGASSPRCIAVDGANNILVGDGQMRAIHVLPFDEVFNIMAPVEKQANR